MFDIGWSELLLIGVVALIVIGPQDLPDMFRTLGRFTAKMRGMARDFQRAMDDAAKESGVDEAARDLKSMTSKKNLGLDALEQAASKFEKWDPAKSVSRPKGPATQALADKKAAEVAARKAAMDPGTAKAGPTAAAETAAKAPAKMAKKTAVKAQAKTVTPAAKRSTKATKPAVAAKPVAPAKTAASKPAARTGTAKPKKSDA
jgi:sec-independent protein translocase protein TatB